MRKKIFKSYLTGLVGCFLMCFSSYGNGVHENKSDDYEFKFMNPSLTIEERVNDLMSHLTTDEKIAQLLNDAPAIPRLGIPEYNWWNECLHGVARSGYATVFPQAIGLAATWNTDLIYEMADVISTEARAKHHEYLRKGERGIYKGLTMWSPNINIFRDPRWGRGQETYGEDPYLTSEIGIAFVKGLQGNHPKYLKVVATPKHYAVHSGPEPERHEFNAITNKRDLYDTYFPTFENVIKESDPLSIMCAYNRYLGEACCGDEFLLQEILRDKWQFKGYVVSDCGAVRDISDFHKITDSKAEAAAIALKAGTDLNCGDRYKLLNVALDEGYISESDIDIALARLFEARFRLGMFDPEEIVPYAQIPFSKNDCPEHRELSIKVARESIVLLKNENNTLPIDKNVKKIAVIGPNADKMDVLLGNYFGTPSMFVTPLEGIKKVVSEKTEVIYSKGCDYTDSLKNKSIIPADVLISNGKKGLKAEYFHKKNFDQEPFLVRMEQEINSPWKKNELPGNIMRNFCVRWTGTLTAPESGNYLFSVTGDDGYRLYINNEKIIDYWSDHGAEERVANLELKEGGEYKVKVEYYQAGGGKEIRLEWTMPKAKNYFNEAVGLASNSDIILFFGGISPELEGEEKSVKIKGFRGGDRTDINLPEIQKNLLQELHATGKPVVFINMSGSAIAFPWVDQNIPAILQAWYPGQEGGTAIADVIFGDYNPGGRLPVTFYKSNDDLPPFENYDMKDRTYRYFQGETLYPFGYGLSYTSFEYSDINLSAEKIKSTEQLVVDVNVKNVGKYAGDEVVQLYIKDIESSVVRPIKDLRKFKRINLKPGESEKIEFTIGFKELSFYDIEQEEYIVEPGEFKIMVGNSSNDENFLTATFVIN